MMAIKKHKIEVFTKWPGGVAFISPFKAGRITNKINTIDGLVDEESIRSQGYFIGFHIEEAKFAFREEGETEIVYEGSVDPSILADRECRIVVGNSAIYEVELDLFSWSDAAGTVKEIVYLKKVTPISEVNVSVNQSLQ